MTTNKMQIQTVKQVPDSGIFSLITRIILFNIFFTAVLTAISFAFLYFLESELFNSTPAIDLIRVFLQNARFSSSALAFVNIPVFALLALITASGCEKVSKFMTVIVRIYYCAALLPVFVLQITSMLLLHIVLKVKEPVLPDIISQVVSLFAVFTKGSANIMIISVIFSIAAASLMFVISTTAFIRLNDYKINDSKKALAASLAVLVLCIFFAKGKVNGFISFEDSRVTSSASLNRYAVNGVFKTVKDFAAFNPSNIKSLSYKDVDDRMGDDRYLFKPDFSMPDNGYEPDDIEEVTPDKSLKRIGAFLKKLKK